MTIYHIINWFFAFSFMGYLLECAVLSCENKKLVCNRGFGHGPFCIIYGFGALGACYILAPISDNWLRLYLASTIMATCMELITAAIMIRLFGSFWWDYSKKPYNYKGIICLESSVGWGFLGIFFFEFLNGFVHGAVSRIPAGFEKRVAIALVLFYLLDFAYSMHEQMTDADDGDSDGQMIGRLKVY